MTRLIGVLVLVAGLISPTAHVASRPAGTWTLALDRQNFSKYEDFAFPDTTHGWLVSAAGDILHTADGGNTWTAQASRMGNLRSIDFVDARRGFAGTLSGVLYGTTDGGVTWSNITANLPKSAKGFCGMTHVGEHVHIVGRYAGLAADYFFSPDGGKTWQASDLLDVAQGLVDVSFVSDTVGFIGGMAKSDAVAVGQGPAIILKTIDRGRTWRPVFTHDGGRGFVWKIFPVTAKLIYASLQSQDGIYRIAKSTDAGDHWEVLTVTTGRAIGPGVQGIGFLDANTGWVGGFFAGMFATTDGGRTWSEVPMVDRTFNRYEKVGPVIFTAGTRGILRYDSK